MPNPTAPRRAAAVVGLTALAVALTGSPAFALDSPLPQLETVTDPVTTTVVDPVVSVLAPSPSPSPSPTPLPVPVPEPLAPVVEPVAEAVAGSTPQEEPVAQQGSAPQPVAAPRSAPRTTTAQGSAPGATAVGGVGTASLGALRGAGGLRAGMGTADVPALGAPMVAAAPRLALPGLLVPETAPVVEVAASRPSSGSSTPAGLPALVVAVAAVVLVAAGAGQVAEMRVRRATVTTD